MYGNCICDFDQDGQYHGVHSTHTKRNLDRQSLCCFHLLILCLVNDKGMDKKQQVEQVVNQVKKMNHNELSNLLKEYRAEPGTSSSSPLTCIQVIQINAWNSYIASHSQEDSLTFRNNHPEIIYGIYANVFAMLPKDY
jgi:hypothetical protein